MQYDVLVIGGGVSGTSIARELSKYELKIALLEKECELAFGVSKSNSGIIHPGTQNPSNSLKGKLCVEGNKLIRQIADELGVDFKEVGELIVGFSEEDKIKLEEIKSEAEKLGVTGLQIVDRQWLQQNEPSLCTDALQCVSYALYAPTAGIISPYRLVYDLAENAMANGVEIFTNNSVIDIRRDTIFCVSTQSSQYHSRYVINCAGLFADEISRFVGIDDFTIRPRKGEEYLLDKKKEHITNHIIFPLPTKESKGILIIKTSDGNPMIGPTAQDVDDKTDLSTSEEGLKRVLSQVQKMIPSICDKDIIAYFAGLRPVAGDDFIIRYEDTVPGFINVAGIQSPGLTASPAIAVMVRDLLKQNGLELIKKNEYVDHRKKTPHLFSSSMEEVKDLIEADAEYGDIVCRCEMVSAKEIRDAIKRGARTLDGIKFRTRAQSGRCHGGFCTTRIMKIMSEELGIPVTDITKRGDGSYVIAKS